MKWVQPWLLSNELINIYFKLLKFNFDSIILIVAIYTVGFPSGSAVKNPPAMQETWIQSLGWEDPLEGRACQPTPVFLAGEFPWTEEPGGLQSRDLQRAGRSWVPKHTHSVHGCCQSIIKASSLAKHLLALVREVLFLQNVFFSKIYARRSHHSFLFLDCHRKKTEVCILGIRW